ncbi:reverse transcriptase domain-containing protein, partial [Nonomuraea basaltis]|uniref:reverse transcriptase domain-containing protein n=1 Tax=Nonomuraea basaltis TaxID=2495887 RepID=UPI001F11359E
TSRDQSTADPTRPGTGLLPAGAVLVEEMDQEMTRRIKPWIQAEWEARFEPRSFGFRPGRSCQDAIESIFQATSQRNAKRAWILDADLAAAFDRIDHSRLLEALGSFPARDMIRDWLKAGVFEKETGFAPTGEGTPQGGVISPLLLNVALHGLEEAAGVRYHIRSRAGDTVAGCPIVVRYADDMIALCHSQRQAQQVKAKLAERLEPRGLVFNEDKTKIVHLSDGFDFLGVNIRRYSHGRLMTKPSAPAVRRLKLRLATEMRSLRGSNAKAVIARLDPIVRGWAAYYRSMVSSRVFAALDNYVWQLTFKWATHSHPNKPTYWIVDQHWVRLFLSESLSWAFMVMTG